MTNASSNAAALVAARKEGGIARTLHDIALLTQRNLLLDVRNPAVIIGSTGFPVFLLLIFTASFARVVNPEGNFADYAQFIVPLNLTQGLLFSTVNLGTAMYNDLERGMDARLRTLPIARSALLAGRILGGAGRLSIQVIIITLVGFLIGFRIQTGLPGMLAFLILPVVFSSAFAWVAVFIAVRSKSSESVQVGMTPWLLPLTFLSIGYVPLEGFPTWIQGFVAFNPVSSVAQALRGIATGTPAWGDAIATLVWSAVITAVFGTLAIRTYQQRTS
jgi:ABC-2 type transport system permease protein